MKIHAGNTLMGLAALLAAGITVHAQNSLVSWPPFARHGKLGGGIMAQAQDGRTPWDHPASKAPDKQCPSPYVFAEVVDPLAVEANGGTFADGIYEDKIVGVYYDIEGNGHGYIYDDHDQTWTTLDDPQAAGLSANFDIWRNDIIGIYLDDEGNVLSFLYDGSTWTTLDYPLAGPGFGGGTWASGIQGDSIVGNYVDASGVSHGFLYKIHDQTWTILDAPLAGTASGQGTLCTGVVGGKIDGYYADSNGVEHAFIYEGHRWATFDAPLAGTALGQGTAFGGVSGNNEVGAYTDSNGVWHGLMFDGRTLTTFDAPLAGTAPGQGTFCSMGNGYNLVGTTIDSDGNYHGYVATPACGPAQ